MIYYYIFALTTAIMAHFSICLPLIKRLKANEKFGANTTKIVTLNIVYFAICLVFAPWVIPVVILYNKEKKEEFINSVYKSIDAKL